MDNLYFLIKRVKTGKIIVYSINYNFKLPVKYFYYHYPICFTSYNIDNLLRLMFYHNLINFISIKHAVYLGREASKLEACIFTQQTYLQS
uniref:DUF4346 domain-containing protein n=1 Tax=Taenioma perpusillum TaxID=210852 RepID=A0A1Z1MRG7_9FLOR|nr:hypothetical protein [Taenioma perpusillum]ARW68469.1 hypothetical protein [Taenioma perpusillum]